MTNQPLPLAGLRVLEFTHAVLGPTCGMLLADFGAEVIKIEPVPEGDPTRYLQGFGTGFAPFLFRNRKSLAIDLKDPAGAEIIHKLLPTTDILVENFGPGTLERLGFGYETLSEQYPQLIYCALKGFMPGPYEKRIALDEIVQMMSGLAYMTGPPGQPLRAGASITDMTTGMMGAMGILLALREREQTGKGQLVRSALFETATLFMGTHLAASAVLGHKVPSMAGDRISAWGVYHQFPTVDGRIVFIGVTSDKQWERFCQVFNRPNLFDNPNLVTNNGRVDAHDWLIPELRQMFAKMDRSEVIRLCDKANLPFAPVARPEDLFDDPHLNETGALLETTLNSGKTVKLPRVPVAVGDHDFGLRNEPPVVGAHGEDLLAELGYSEEEIGQLREHGITI